MENNGEYLNFDEAKTAAENMDINENPQETDTDPQTSEYSSLEGLELSPEADETEQEQYPMQQEQEIVQNENPEQMAQQEILPQPEQQSLPNEELNQLMAQVSQLTEQNQQLSKVIDELSNKNKEQVIEETIDLPVLDLSGMAFDDEETMLEKQKEYAKKMAEYVREGVLKEMNPFLTQAKQGIAEREKNEAVNALKTLPELKDIENYMPQIEKIMESNSLIHNSNENIADKIISAYAIAKGAEFMNAPPKTDPTADELMEFYKKNPEFQSMIEQDRLNRIKPNQDIPQMSASSGAVNAALHIPEKPKTFEEAKEKVAHMFGV